MPAPSLVEMDRSRKNRGVRGAFQARMLRRLNQLNRKLKEVPLVPSLENPLFRSLRITPRRICQNRLANVSTDPLRLPNDIREHLLTGYTDDWAYVNQRRENRM